MTLRTMLVPILAVAVASSQMICATAGALTPWKGGGFGMFASIDSPFSRVLAVRVADEEGRHYRVRFGQESLPGPLSARFRLRAVTFPTSERLRLIALGVLEADLRPAADGASSLPIKLEQSKYDSAIRALMATSPVVDLVAETRSPRTLGTLRIRTVDVEVLKLEFDRHSMLVRLQNILTVVHTRSGPA